MVLSMNLELKRFLCFWAVIHMYHSYININLFCHTLKEWDWEIKTLPIVFVYKTGLFHIGGVLFHEATEGIAKAWSIDRQIQAPAGLLGVSTPTTFTPFVVTLRLTHTLPDFQELEPLIEEGIPTT